MCEQQRSSVTRCDHVVTWSRHVLDLIAARGARAGRAHRGARREQSVVFITMVKQSRLYINFGEK